jgi:hypothetical protein
LSASCLPARHASFVLVPHGPFHPSDAGQAKPLPPLTHRCMRVERSPAPVTPSLEDPAAQVVGHGSVAGPQPLSPRRVTSSRSTTPAVPASSPSTDARVGLKRPRVSSSSCCSRLRLRSSTVSGKGGQGLAGRPAGDHGMRAGGRDAAHHAVGRPATASPALRPVRRGGADGIRLRRPAVRLFVGRPPVGQARQSAPVTIVPRRARP